MGPNDKILWGQNWRGKPAYMGRRTGAHLDRTIEELNRFHPGAKLHLIQSAYNAGVPASAGSHDLDAALDVWIQGMGWWDQQKWLRARGWAAWYRYPPSFGRHVHMITLGYGDAPVGYLIPGQVADYYKHLDGLKYHRPDPSWHPQNIHSTIFNYNAYVKEQADMKPEEIADAPITLRTDGKTVKTTIQGAMQDEHSRTMAQGDRLRVIDKKLNEILTILKEK